MKTKKFKKVVKYNLEDFYVKWGVEPDEIKNPSFRDVLFLPFYLIFICIFVIITYPYYVYINIKAYREVYFKEIKE